MFKWYKKLKRDLTSRQKCLVVLTTIVILYTLGLLDKLSEKSYDEFEWESDVNSKFEFPRYTRLPKCKIEKNVNRRLLILIKSSSKHHNMRDAVRNTWGKYQIVNNVEITPLFIIGRNRNLNEEGKIDKEYEAYKDIISINSIDSYRNNTYKLFAAINFANSPIDCPIPDFVLMVDDDYMVHIPNLVKFLSTKSNDDLIYEGFVFDSSPFRFVLHKHRISLTEYPYSRYPPYVSAGSVFMNSKTVKLFHEVIPKLKIFPFDDVFTGIVAKTVRVPAKHNENFVFWSRHISKNEWNEGIIAAHGYARQDLETEYNNIFD